MSYVEWVNKAIKEAFEQEDLELKSDILPFYALLLLVAGRKVTMENVHDAQVCCQRQRKNCFYRFIPFCMTAKVARTELELHRKVLADAYCEYSAVDKKEKA